MNTKYTKNSLSKLIRSYVNEKKEWFEDVRKMDISDENKLLFFRREANNILDDFITISNIIKRKLK